MTLEAVSPATPSDFSTSWQNWWVVAIVAASKPASASRSRCLRRPALVVGTLQQVRDQLVVADRRRIVESDDSVGDLAAHPLAQLLAGRPTERDEQHLVQRGLALGEIARHQTGQRERLAGARAGLQHRGGAFGRQRAEQVESLHQVGILSARSIGSQSRQA